MALAFAGGGCSDNGTYQLAFALQDSTGGPAMAATGALCGRHGVAAWYVTENDSPVGSVIVPCGQVTYRHSVSPGAYTLAVQALDERGTFSDQTQKYLYTEVPTIAVQAGKTVDVGTVVLRALPECEDGIDNDCDGLVDLADPSCQSATWPTEVTGDPAGTGCKGGEWQDAGPDGSESTDASVADGFVDATSAHDAATDSSAAGRDAGGTNAAGGTSGAGGNAAGGTSGAGGTNTAGAGGTNAAGGTSGAGGTGAAGAAGMGAGGTGVAGTNGAGNPGPGGADAGPG